jgi:hypothetical protein
MSIPRKVVAVFLPLLAGCFVDPEERPQEYSSPQQDEQPAQAETDVVVAPEVDEVNYVVYREYFGCTEQEIEYFPHYRRYYGLSDDDLYFIYFTSRQSNVSFDACFHSYYYDCDRNYDRLVVYYHVPRERYFVAIGGDVSPPPQYARAYGSYRSGNAASVSFTNQEYVALVHMKVGVEYQGQPPATYFSRVRETGSTSRVLVENRDHSGRGGRTAAGTTITATAPHPWTMPPQQKQQWHQERQASVARSEVKFKEVHQEQVQKVEHQRSAAQTRPPQRGNEHEPGLLPPPRQIEGQPGPSETRRPHAQEPPIPADRPHGQEPQRPVDRPHAQEPQRPIDHPHVQEPQRPVDHPHVQEPQPPHQVPEHPPQNRTEKPPPKPPQHDHEEKPRGGEEKKDKGDRREP